MDERLLSALDKAKAEVDRALCDSFNTSAVMRILSDLVTEFNSLEGLSDHTVFVLARWITRIITIFGLKPEGNLSDHNRIGWSGLSIPSQAEPYVYPASQLRDLVRALACSSSLDHTAIMHSASGITIVASAAVAESAKPYYEVLQQFHSNVKALAAQEAPAESLLALCDQLRDVHFWNLDIYLEDRKNSRRALVRPLERSLVEARADQERANGAKAKAKLEQATREAERETELRNRAKIDPLLMFQTSDEYSRWDESGIPTLDAAGNDMSKNRRKKLIKEWEKQKQSHEEWLATQSA